MAFPEDPLQPCEPIDLSAEVGHTPSDAARQGSSEERQSTPDVVQGTDFCNRATWDRVVNVVHQLRQYDARELAASTLGLPTDIPWPQIDAYIDAQDYVYLARDFGLPEDAPQDNIEERLQQEEREKWLAHVRSLDLPDDATGKDVDDAERSIRARRLGLDATAAWGDIWRAEKENRLQRVLEALGIEARAHWDWEDVLQRALCVSGDITADRYIERIQEIRAWHISQITEKGSS